MPVQPKQLWIGLVEVRQLGGNSELLGDNKGAFVNVVTWAADAEQFRQNAELLITELGGLFVADVRDPASVNAKRARSGGGWDESIEDLISRAQTNPNAIMYGTFHMFKKDDA